MKAVSNLLFSKKKEKEKKANIEQMIFLDLNA